MVKRRFFLIAIGTLLAMANSERIGAADISEEDPGLTKRCGPWMIQVAVLRSEKAADRTAATLVTDLRKQGIPAYAVSRTIKTQDKRSEAMQSETVVLAGNYESADSTTAQATLKFIKAWSGTPSAKQLANETGNAAPFKAAYLRPNPLNEALGAISNPK